MSITLTAYPMGFLINPQDSKNEQLQSAQSPLVPDDALVKENLYSVRILTNIEYSELKHYLTMFESTEVKPGVYMLQNGMLVEWTTRGKYCVATISGCKDSKTLQQSGEEYFQMLDSIAARNVRLIEGAEYFYYNYQTGFSKITDIYSSLKNEGAEQIFTTPEDEVLTLVDGQSVKYYKPDGAENYMVEIERKVNIINIGLTGAEGMNVTYGLTNLEIQTNIKPEELKSLLYKAKYLYYPENSQTPLKNSNATLNWVLKNGYYAAVFSGLNASAISKEVEIIFRKLSRASGRDCRLINDTFTAIYTYKTNYTDKGVLLNTLLEHGAEEICESGEEVSCKLFGMEMVYSKKNGSEGYTLDVTQVSDVAECREVIGELNEEYGLNIQEITYNKIKERLAEANMSLESETVLEDNSIVLTIEV